MGEFQTPIESAPQAPLRPAELERYRADVRTRLQGSASSWLDQSILLSLAALPVRVREAGAPYRTGENVEEALYLADALASFQRDFIAVLGEPGAGKTTLLQQQALAALDTGSHVPIYVELVNYRSLTKAVDLVLAELQASGIPHESAQRHLEEGGFLVLLDGLNEVDESELLVLAREIGQLHRRHGSHNQFVVTCRTTEWPEEAIDHHCRRFELLSIAHADAIEYLAAALSITAATAAAIFDRFDWGIQQLTHTPLLLNMLAAVLAELQPESDAEAFWTSDDWIGRLPRTRAALYQQFTRAMLVRDFNAGKTKLLIDLHERAIMRLARSMDNSAFVIDTVEAERLLSEFYVSNRIEPYGFTVRQVLKDTLHAPPLVSTKGTIGHYSKLAFMHQSFQEYYTALDMVRRLGDEASPDALDIQALARYATERRWWETLILASGLLDDATALVQLLIDSNELHLAARCIHQSQYVAPELVDRLILAGYERFKYSDDFDYDLNHLLKDIFNRSSAALPKRLVEDISWWVKVYTQGTPRALHHLSESQLLQSLDSVDAGLLAGAVYTCAVRGLAGACGRLLDLLDKPLGERVREQVVIALGKLRCPGGVEKLRSIALNPHERPWILALALNSLSEFHEPSVIPTLTEYLLNPKNPFREAAAWALSRMGDLVSSEPLLQALRLEGTEVDEFSGSRYALGTTLFALGQLRDVSVVPFLVEWAATVQDPFVLEDLVYTLGELGDRRGVPVVVAQLQSPDAVVRKRAIEARVKLRVGSATGQLRGCLSDLSPFVQQAAARALSVLAASAPGQPVSPLSGREMELVPLLMAELSNQEIADRLFISENTVRNHITHILRKLNLGSRTGIAMWGVQQGIAPAPRAAH